MPQKKPKKYVRRRRLAMHATRRLPKSYIEKMNKTSLELLDLADVSLETALHLDTHIRDIVSEGIAYLVWAAFDCQAQAQNLSIDDWKHHVESSVFKWFAERSEGFAPWFCLAASSLFMKSRPPICGGFVPPAPKRSNAKKES